MCSGGGDAPESPDPYATAAAQRDAFIDSSKATTALNRYDEDSPFGSSFWQTVDANNRDLGMVDGMQRMRKVTALHPDEQRLLDQSRANKLALGNIAQSKIGEVGSAFGTPFDFSGAPGAGYGMLRQAKELAKAPGPSLEAYKALAMRGGPKLDEAARQQVQDALYRRETAELDPRYKQQQIDLETQLANQGVMRGSEAWTKATTDFNRNKDAAYGDALDRSILAGGAEQSRLFGLKSARRAQNLGALQNLYGMQSSRRKDKLAGYERLFGLSQTGRQNWLQEQMTKRKIPMDELAMLLGQSQGYNIPQFKSPADANVGTPDIQGLLSGQYKNQLDLWGQDKAADSALTGNAIGAAGAVAGATASQWGPWLASLFASSRDYKTDSAPMNEVLPAIGQLAIESWRYKPQFNDPSRHIGPYAENFKELFGVGDGKTIHVVDALGVCLKAIQELSMKVRDLEAKGADYA